MSGHHEKVGASKSLNKTIAELEEFVQAGRERLPDEKLREVLHEHLADLAEKWFERGFKRGCVEARRGYRAEGSFPTRVKYNGNRELFTGMIATCV